MQSLRIRRAVEDARPYYGVTAKSTHYLCVILSVSEGSFTSFRMTCCEVVDVTRYYIQ